MDEAIGDVEPREGDDAPYWTDGKEQDEVERRVAFPWRVRGFRNVVGHGCSPLPV